jgi:CMP-N,N'-diacetyllegionaminic acid synthase
LSKVIKKNKKIVSLILARGGSKGLPDKNVRSLEGKPLITWTIEAALLAVCINRVIISTDSTEIADIAKRAGAEVPFMRPENLASDESLAIDTLIYTVDRINSEIRNHKKQERLIEEVVLLQPTSPFRNNDDIDNAIKIFRDMDADSVISCCAAPHPVQWYKYIDEDGVLRHLMPDGNSSNNRQSIRQSYLPNGAIYIFKYSLLKETRTFYSKNTYPYVMPVSRSTDIDSLDDFRWAEFQMKNNLNMN